MKPTLEEVNRVAAENGAVLFKDGDDILYAISFPPEGAIAFAEYWMKEQRESDALVCKNFADEFLVGSRTGTEFIRIACLNKNSAFLTAESAIRNNTGE